MYRTTDFYLACYLVHRREKLLRIDPISESRVVFVFEKFGEQTVLDFYNRVPLSDANPGGDNSFLGIVDAIRHTRELLHNSLENPQK